MNERLDEIVIASLSEENLTEDEKMVLVQWLEESDEHKREYELLMKIYESGKNFRQMKGVEREKAWQKIRHGMTELVSRKRRIGYVRMAGIAVVFILLVGVASNLFWKIEQPASSDVVKYILPGSGQVQLKLGNGKNIELGQTGNSVVVSDDRIVAKCDSNVLDYQMAKDQTENIETEENTLFVPVAAEYCLLLSDGTRVYVNAASELRYPTVFSGNKREVYLKGEAYFEVAKDSAHEFIVHTQRMDIQVLGTSFDINAYADREMVSATLTSGSIKAICRGKMYDIRPGEQIQSNRVSGEVRVREVDAELYTSWKDGYYYFEACPLEDIMQVLSRWYGIQPFFQQADLKSIEFSGRLKRYEEVDQLFRKFEQTRNIRFNRQGNTVTVSTK